MKVGDAAGSEGRRIDLVRPLSLITRLFCASSCSSCLRGSNPESHRRRVPSGRAFICGLLLLLASWCLGGSYAASPQAPNVLLQRFSSDHLKEVRHDTQQLRAEAKPSERSDG